MSARPGAEALCIRSAWQMYAAARRYFCPAVRRWPAASSARACASSWSAMRCHARMKSAVPASPRAAASRIGRQARSTSSMVPPLFSVATTPRFQM
ncbi:hypothetical protein [Phytohabitans rumicis]|uniref:Uncharacterized protein n=1 Tax=Phytohabitans rumicis TaxID=1076125 RepID=A0A6V8KML1_9ACTN|nr:hypothetical protein [Phytohabitans rumicis]GFJ86412.1 hypothetical protein Prum_000540 [Phytohabitans rumicis]